jgi:AcrR family transcriptional regulator
MREGGPDAVKARVIARALGVSVGTVYNLFGQLDELFLQTNARVYDELYEAVTAARDEERARGGDAPRQMKALARAYLAFVARNAELWSGVLAYNRRGRAGQPSWYREKERALLGVIGETIEAFPGAGDAARRQIAARALWAAVHGIVTVSVTGRGLIAPEGEVREQLDLIVGAVAAKLAA